MIGREGATMDEVRGTGELVLPGPSSAWQGRSWSIRGGSVALDRPVVMGILNLTPDSFSDGGELSDTAAALRRAEAMVDHGAGILDVGGESTRPGASSVSAEQELERLLPFLEAAAGTVPVPISVDTRKAEVAQACLEAGASVVNDVSGLTHDPRMAGVVAEASAGVVIMHMRGDPSTMASLADYGHLAAEVAGELSAAVQGALHAGIAREAIVVDPGIGFAKTATQSLALLGNLGSIRALGFPVLVGPSRKSFLGAVLGVPANERLHGTVAACVAAYLQGARIFRVHDVKPVVEALQVMQAIQEAAGQTAERQDP